MRFRTKKQAQKEARQLNKGSSVKHLVVEPDDPLHRGVLLSDAS
jgi:hypothetical protein